MKTLKLLNYKYQVLTFLKGNITAEEYLVATQLLQTINTALADARLQSIQTVEVA